MYKQLKRTEKIFILIYAFFCTCVPLYHAKHYEHELVTVRLDKTPKYDKKNWFLPSFYFISFPPTCERQHNDKPTRGADGGVGPDTPLLTAVFSAAVKPLGAVAIPPPFDFAGWKDHSVYRWSSVTLKPMVTRRLLAAWIENKGLYHRVWKLVLEWMLMLSFRSTEVDNGVSSCKVEIEVIANWNMLR